MIPKKIEKDLVKDAFRACGYPEWLVNKNHSKTKERREKEQYLSKVCIPYNRGLSEKFARIMKNYKIDTIHKPSNTIKNVLCSKAKDKLDPMDKPGVVYSIYCNAHQAHYIGETGRAARERFYEHRVISHKDSKRSHSLPTEIVDIPQESENIRRSKRDVKRVDYKALNSGSNQLLTVGDTVVSEHMALNDHKDGDIELKLLEFEPNWRKRRIKETIAINRQKPDLNGNEGKFISALFDQVPSKFESSRGSTNQIQRWDNDVTELERKVRPNGWNATH